VPRYEFNVDIGRLLTAASLIPTMGDVLTKPQSGAVSDFTTRTSGAMKSEGQVVAHAERAWADVYQTLAPTNRGKWDYRLLPFRSSAAAA